MRKAWQRALAIAITLTAGATLTRATPIGDADFVRVEGARFLVGKQPFTFVGANAELLHGTLNRDRYLATLDALAADGVTVARVWALGEGAPLAADAPAATSDAARDADRFRDGPEGFVESSFVQLDRVLVAARARGIRLIVTVANYWGDYGGIPAYLAWAGLPTRGPGARDRFFTDDRARRYYRAHLEHLLGRKNTVSGVRYTDDPTVLSWELFNELRIDGPQAASARVDFVREMARDLKEQDPRHLVAAGLMGYGSLAERARWVVVCELPEVDYCDSHLYPETTDRIEVEASSLESTERSAASASASRALARLQGYIDDRVQLAHFVAKKPIVFGEFGFQTTRAGWLGVPRARWFESLLARVAFDDGNGALAWIYQPWGGHPRDFGIYVDRTDTDDVRAVIRAAAAARVTGAGEASPRNPLLGAAQGDRPLYDPYVSAHGTATQRVRRHGRTTILELDPEHYTRARWERVGTYDEGALRHAYGAGTGFFEWRFTVPPGEITQAVLSVRISSEFPDDEAPPDGSSRVLVSMDGQPMATIDAPPDDGRGRIVQAVLRDRKVLSRLGGHAHVLRLAVEAGPHANGLCIYGAATGRPDATGVVPSPTATPTTPITLRLTAPAP